MRKINEIDKTVATVLVEMIVVAVLVLGMYVLVGGFSELDGPITPGALYLVGVGIIETALVGLCLCVFLYDVQKNLAKLGALLRLRDRGDLE